MRHVLLEVIVTSLDDARAAAAGGADRFELCAALALGGLTPSLGLIDSIKRELPDMPVMFMLRPREGGMAYSEADLSVMQRDAELALAHGADGLVFGVLTDRGEVDASACQRLLSVARQRPDTQTVFHRAFDVVADSHRALEQLIDLGFTRVLTSGRARRAAEGVAEIRRTIDRAAGRIEVLPGGGINAGNASKIVDATGADQVHLSATRTLPDHSTGANPLIRFTAVTSRGKNTYRATDPDLVRAVRDATN